MKKKLTGRHVAIIFVSGFGVVFAVNAAMATRAISQFGGVIVENSYVASQEFNGWLAKAESQRALGWTAQSSRDEAGHLQITATGLPEGASGTYLWSRRLLRPKR